MDKAESQDIHKTLCEIKKRLGYSVSLEKNQATHDFIRPILKMLSPKDPDGISFKRIGRRFDGGYVMADAFDTGGVAYSLGIKQDVTWDSDMVELGYDIYMYDHTIDGLPVSSEKFNFYKQGISGKESAEFTTLPAQMKKHGHTRRTDLVLKVDIEGDEWPMINSMSMNELNCFKQIAIELHGFKKLHKAFWAREVHSALQKLRKNHIPIHIHGNNNGHFCCSGGLVYPSTLEVTFLRSDVCNFSPCIRMFPTKLDHPNNPLMADLYLQGFQY